MSLRKDIYVTLRNGWVLGPLKARNAKGPNGTESRRFFVAGPTTLEWSESGDAHWPEYNVAKVGQ